MPTPSRVCVACGVRWAVAVHHEPPKSLNPRHACESETEYPVCNECHERLQNMPREDAKKLLLSKTSPGEHRLSGS